MSGPWLPPRRPHPRGCGGEKAKSNVGRDCSRPLFIPASATMAAAAAHPSPRGPSNYQPRAPRHGDATRSPPQPENKGRGLAALVAPAARSFPRPGAVDPSPAAHLLFIRSGVERGLTNNLMWWRRAPAPAPLLGRHLIKLRRWMESPPLPPRGGVCGQTPHHRWAAGAAHPAARFQLQLPAGKAGRTV